jgi:vacuolar-type H+-ATPase subunit F/Vma7
LVEDKETISGFQLIGAGGTIVINWERESGYFGADMIAAAKEHAQDLDPKLVAFILEKLRQYVQRQISVRRYSSVTN